MECPIERSRCLNILNEYTPSPKSHLPGFRPLHEMPTFKPFEEIAGPSTCATDGRTIWPGLLGIYTLLRGTA